MSYQEKSAIAHLISTVLVIGLYGFFVFGMYQAGQFDGPDGLSLLGKAVLVMVVGGIVVNIVASILVSIVAGIVQNVTSGEFEPLVTDERDRLIELKAMSFATYALGIGFVGSMGLLALGQTAFVVLNLIVISGALADILGSLVKLVLYRRGF